MQAKAAIIEKQGGEFVLDNVELGGPQAGELRIKIAAAGICHTDLSVRDQYYPTPLPAVLGHEGAGWVEEVGPGVVGLEEGDPVVLSFSYCGACPTCLSGEHAYCPSLFPLNFAGRRLDGSTPITRNGEDVNAMFFGQSSFATHAIVRQENCVKVASDAPLELLGPLGCGVQTGAGSVLNALQPKPGSSIAIFGAGSVGLSAIMAAKASGCTKIIAVDLQADRLKKAEKLGATHVFDSSKTDPLEAIQSLTGLGADYAIDTTAVPKVVRTAIDAINTRGTMAIVGGAPLGTEASIDLNNMLFGRKVIGIVEGSSTPQIFIPKLIDLHQAGLFPFDELVTYYDFDDINKAVHDTEKTGKSLKAVLKMAA